MTPAVITRVRNRPGVARGPCAHEPPVEDQTDLVGAADVEVVADDLFEEDPARDRGVEHLGQRELGLQDRQLVAVAGGPIGGGERVRQDGQPLTQQPVDLVGPEPSQIACTAAGSSTAANPLSKAVNPIPAFAAWRLAHSLPLRHSLALYGKVGAELQEERAEIGNPHSRSRSG